MFRIRRIFDDISKANRETVRKVGELLRQQFPDVPEHEVSALGERLTNPFLKRFDTILYVAESGRHRLQGCAILMIEPVLRFAFLDFISTGRALKNRGIGGALYGAIRREAVNRRLLGVFYECLPDDPALCPSAEVCALNAKRLRFYEKFGARPIVNTLYELPLTPDDPYLPYLVFDNTLGRPLSARDAREVVRAILERKYSYLCPADYVEKVVGSFRDSPVKLREFRYVRATEIPVSFPGTPTRRLSLVLNEGHSIHHVRERGYVEAPVRIPAIMKELIRLDGVEILDALPFPEKHILAVHSAELYGFMKSIADSAPPGPSTSVYPYVFPIRNRRRMPRDPAIQAGYYCIDTFTPINPEAFHAARGAVNSALTGATRLLDGEHCSYALVRPPGHHAERQYFGGFCYFNNNAVAAHFLSRHGTVAILDIDYHHGNGQQQIFSRRRDVLTVSLHGHPDFAYPYFSGFADEDGEGEGKGFNRNLPLPEMTTPADYLAALGTALQLIREFSPAFLVVACGFDTAASDPTGTWANRARDFHTIGKAIGGLRKPTLVVQEGGYRTTSLGTNAAAFFSGLLSW